MNEILIKKAKETIYHHKCKNGLNVYIWPYDLNEQITCTLTVKYGSIHTKFKVNNKLITVPNGIAHFLEHIKFNIKKDLTAHDVFYKLGSYTNAYTTYDHTCYELVCTKNINENLNELLNFVYTPYFTKETIAKEKPIIVEEAKSVLDNPYNQGYFKLQQNIYKNSNYRNIITGTPEEIKSITIDDVNNVYNNFYHPENMFLTVTGNINPYEIEKIVDEYFKNKEFPKWSNPEVIFEKEPHQVMKDEDEVVVNVQKEKLLLAFKYPNNILSNFDEIKKRYIISIILWYNFSSISEFNFNLIDKKLIDNMYYSVEETENNTTIYFEVSTDFPDKIAKDIINKMDNLMIDEKSLERRKKTEIASEILGYDSADGVNSKIVGELINFNKIIDNSSEIFKSISIEDINIAIDMLKKYCSSKVVLKPNKKA